ncbi:exodeoxyribonuclease VII large subunit [Pedobacter steynii]|uniref:Exodeoxyribonuclease 7 large subunit n=1 Tax=Pedobacter steynii TaxID=430522 RepID=A0A1H0CC22_9SPHI|nr:exodeoxyribonuclease VII large subunit [Pedobacter steynii]NQX41523.1 exodeoxyribonuclease VII large subunit [Pedobacter steynii]SDN55409.1 exodeoxyribonuclease VII large subunit [Pedobacter steynii]
MSTIPSIKLSELTSQIQQVIDGAFGHKTFWIIADITNYTYKPQSNYHYFELVEKDKTAAKILAKVAGRAWGNASLNISNFEKATGQKFKNDINVLIQVSVQYNPSFGLQLNLLDIDTNFTLGLFEQQRKETLERLVRENQAFIKKAGEGYITRNSELALNQVIQRIAVISSDTSAGFQDFRHTLEHNPFDYKFYIDDYFALVQGDGNAKQFLARIIEVFESQKPYDALVIIRGGGAQTDFLIFDNYELNRAIAKFPIPVITGIGHQKNETIADLMAHTSTKTPTKAAEFIIAHNRAFEDNLIGTQKMILIKTYQMINHHKDRLVRLNQITINTTRNLLHEHHKTIMNLSGMILTNPRIIISNRRKDLSNLQLNLQSYSKLYFLNKTAHIAHFQSVMRIMSPQNILNKGFAIIKVDGKIAGNADQIEVGTELTVRLANSEIKTIVKSKSAYDENEFNL